MADDQEKHLGTLLVQMREHRREFGDYVDEWRGHKNLELASIDRVNQIHATIGNIGKHVENLNQLPAIAGALGDIKDRLIEPATNKDGYTRIIIALFAIIVPLFLALAVIVVVTTLKHSDTTLEASHGNSKIKVGHDINQPEAGEKKQE